MISELCNSKPYSPGQEIDASSVIMSSGLIANSFESHFRTFAPVYTISGQSALFLLCNPFQSRFTRSNFLPKVLIGFPPNLHNASFVLQTCQPSLGHNSRVSQCEYPMASLVAFQVFAENQIENSIHAFVLGSKLSVLKRKRLVALSDLDQATNGIQASRRPQSLERPKMPFFWISPPSSLVMPCMLPVCLSFSRRFVLSLFLHFPMSVPKIWGQLRPTASSRRPGPGWMLVLLFTAFTGWLWGLSAACVPT